MKKKGARSPPELNGGGKYALMASIPTMNPVFNIGAWRNWQTRPPQERVGDRAGSSPVAPTIHRHKHEAWF